MNRLGAVLLSALLASCAGAPETTTTAAAPDRSPGGGATAAEGGESRQNVPAGTWIGLEVELSSREPDYPLAVRCLFHEALAQSPHFDFGRGEEGAVQIVLRGSDPAAEPTRARLVTSLRPARGALVPLAGVDFERGSLEEAIDELALATRRALGEPPDSLQRERRSCALFVSEVERCAAYCERALDELESGHRQRAAIELRKALRADDRSPLALSILAGLRADQGRVRSASDLAARVLKLGDRASPSSFGRALRVRLMQERKFDELLRITAAALEERPHDPDLAFSRAFALCMTERYSGALPELERLRVRFPRRPGPLYCLAHAWLAQQNADAVLALSAELEKLLPDPVSFRILAQAYVIGERYEALETHLRLARERIEREPSLPPELGSELNEMQCAAAILRGDQEGAVALLLAELDRLRADPRLLERRAERLPDLFWCLARLGRAEAGRLFLQSVDRARPDRRVLPYVETARAIARTWLGKGPTDKELAAVRDFGLISWSERLAAQRSIRLGQYARAETWLAASVRRADQLAAALEQAELWKSTGRTAEAAPLLRTLHRELFVPRMSDPRGFVLSRPELAIIARAARPK